MCNPFIIWVNSGQVNPYYLILTQLILEKLPKIIQSIYDFPTIFPPID